jgi:Holliday junction resolvase RusA-like endonuclease
MEKVIIKDIPLISENAAYKNREWSGKRGRKSTQDAEMLKTQIGWEIKTQCPGITPDGDNEFEVHLQITFPDKRKRDISNYEKLIFDSMIGIVFDDDRQISYHTNRRIFGKKWELVIEFNRIV